MKSTQIPALTGARFVASLEAAFAAQDEPEYDGLDDGWETDDDAPATDRGGADA